MRIWYDGLCLRLWTQPFDINVVSESRSWRQLLHSFSLLHILWRNPSESVRSEFDYISAGILSSFDFSVLSGCYDNTVKIHTLTGKELLTLPAHSAPVRCLCWISSGIVFCLWKVRGAAYSWRWLFAIWSSLMREATVLILYAFYPLAWMVLGLGLPKTWNFFLCNF